MSSDWRCDTDGPVLPLHVVPHLTPQTVGLVRSSARVPLWCPWPLPVGWTVTGAAWAGDERTGGRATALACSGPSPLGGLAEVVLVAEEPRIGLGARYAGHPDVDPGPALSALISEAPHARVLAAGQHAPLWSIPTPAGRGAYVGEASALWLWAVLWPAEAGYLLAEDVVLHDLRDHVPPLLPLGATSPRLTARD